MNKKYHSINRIIGFMFTCGFGIFALSAGSYAKGTKMLQQPDISAKNISFVYAGDIWVADRNGKNPRRLTSHPAREVRPQFSPDGKQIAFTAAYDGNADVYVISTEGGQPKRLTWHSGADLVEGWSADGKSVVFTSTREINHNRAGRDAQLDRGISEVLEALKTHKPVRHKTSPAIPTELGK